MKQLKSQILQFHLVASNANKVQTILKDHDEIDFTFPNVEAQKVRGTNTLRGVVIESEKPSMEFTCVNPQFSDASRPTSSISSDTTPASTSDISRPSSYVFSETSRPTS